MAATVFEERALRGCLARPPAGADLARPESLPLSRRPEPWRSPPVLASALPELLRGPVSYTHLTLPTTPYV